MLTPQAAARPAVGRVLARPSTSLAPRIVILGGGFAAVTTALELAKRGNSSTRESSKPPLQSHPSAGQNF